MHICPKFWLAPLTGSKSQAGVLVHEASHFEVIGDTRDLSSQDLELTKGLARRSPFLAIENAYAYGYFAENVPPIA